MSSVGIPAELAEARDRIDQIDRKLIELLAQRFSLTHQVGMLKARQDLDALDAEREAQKLEELRALCHRHGLDPALVSELFRRIMEEVVRNHKRLRGQC